MPSATDARPWRNWYNKSRWRALRANQLWQRPLCKMCQEQGIVTVATVVDHIKEHKGNETLFFNPANLQSLCAPHHDTAKQRDEARGYEGGMTADGLPLDSNHHWNR